MQATFLDSDNAADWDGATRLAIGESSVDVGAVVVQATRSSAARAFCHAS